MLYCRGRRAESLGRRAESQVSAEGSENGKQCCLLLVAKSRGLRTVNRELEKVGSMQIVKRLNC